MGELSILINIGPNLEEQLNMIGVFTYEELKQIGAKNAWLNIKSIDQSAWINRLMALEGAIENVKKSELSLEKKSDLKEFYNSHK